MNDHHASPSGFDFLLGLGGMLSASKVRKWRGGTPWIKVGVPVWSMPQDTDMVWWGSQDPNVDFASGGNGLAHDGYPQAIRVYSPVLGAQDFNAY